MPTVILPDCCDGKLKRLVTDPFEQTRESILMDLIDQELERRSGGNAIPASSPNEAAAERINPDAPESLLHSKVTSAKINGKDIHRPKWNVLREQMHILALKRLGSYQAMQKASDARLRQGKYEADGFKYLPDGDFSIQGVDANLCWAHSLKLAKALDMPIQARIIWRDKDKAIHPGQNGFLEWTPTKPKTN